MGDKLLIFHANNVKIGDFVDVEITEATPFALKAILV